MGGKTISIANQKGGVGKTVTAVNFAAQLAIDGKKVLVVDFDPQANASSYLGFDNKTNECMTMGNLIDLILKQGCIEYSTTNSWYTNEDRELMHQLHDTFHNAIVHSQASNVDYIPTNITLAGAEMMLISSVYRNQALKILLSYFTADYEYIIIDCAPTLGIMLINALVASDEVIIPIQAEEFAVDGIVQMLDTITNVRRAENHALQIGGFLLTMVQTNVIEYRDIKEGMTEQFGDLVFSTAISRTVQVSRSTSKHMPIVHTPGSKAGEQYKEWVLEYLSRQEDKQ